MKKKTKKMLANLWIRSLAYAYWVVTCDWNPWYAAFVFITLLIAIFYSE